MMLRISWYNIVVGTLLLLSCCDVVILMNATLHSSIMDDMNYQIWKSSLRNKHFLHVPIPTLLQCATIGINTYVCIMYLGKSQTMSLFARHIFMEPDAHNVLSCIFKLLLLLSIQYVKPFMMALFPTIFCSTPNKHCWTWFVIMLYKFDISADHVSDINCTAINALEAACTQQPCSIYIVCETWCLKPFPFV